MFQPDVVQAVINLNELKAGDVAKLWILLCLGNLGVFQAQSNFLMLVKQFSDQNLWVIQNIFNRDRWGLVFSKAVLESFKDTPFFNKIPHNDQSPLWLMLSVLTKTNLKILNYFVSALVCVRIKTCPKLLFSVKQGRLHALLKILKNAPKNYTIPANLEAHALSNWIMKDTGAGSCVDGRRAAVNSLPIETDEIALHFIKTSSRMEILQNIRLNLENLKKSWNLSEEVVSIAVLRKTNPGLQYSPTKQQINFITSITKFDVPEGFRPRTPRKLGLVKGAVDPSKTRKKSADWVYHHKIQETGRTIGDMGSFCSCLCHHTQSLNQIRKTTRFSSRFSTMMGVSFGH